LGFILAVLEADNVLALFLISGMMWILQGGRRPISNALALSAREKQLGRGLIGFWNYRYVAPTELGGHRSAMSLPAL
jgi:hypothetical protein